MGVKIMIYDYIIIGGGLAGSTIGFLLNKKGYNVLIIEKENIKTKSKLCGGILTQKSYNLLIGLFNKKDIDKFIINEFNNCSVISNVKLNLNNLKIKIINRNEVDNYILNQYLNTNGKLIYDCTIQNIDFSKNIITCNDKTYEYKKLIAADGVLSQVRKTLNGKLQNRSFALEIFSNQKYNDFIIEFGDNFTGYSWIIPTKINTIIGTGEINNCSNAEIEFKRMSKKYKFKTDKPKGAFLPTGNDIFLENKNVYFVGDAAGLISPITGEGIYSALLSSKLLFESFNNNNYSKLMKPLIKKIHFENKLLKMIYNKQIRNFIFKIMKKNNPLSKFLKKIVIKLILE